MEDQRLNLNPDQEQDRNPSSGPLQGSCLACDDGRDASSGAGLGQGSKLNADQAAQESEILSASGIALPAHWLRIVMLVWAGQAISIISSAAAGWAVIWYVTESTGSALMLSVMTVCAMLPAGVLSPFGGVIADRHNRKLIMIVSDLVVAVFSLALASLLLIGEVSFGLLAAFAAMRSIGQAFHSPAFMATIPMLVPNQHLLRINMLDQMVMSASSLVSPALGIFLYSSFGFSSALFLDAAGAVFAVFGLLFAHVPTVCDADSAKGRVLHRLGEGWRALCDDRGLLILLLLMLGALVTMAPVVAIFPLMTYDYFGGDGYGAALVEAAYGGGLIIGSVVLMIWGGGKRLARLIALSMLLSGVTVIACGVLPPDGFWLFVLLNLLCGIVLAGFQGPQVTLVQRRIPGEKLGRVMGFIVAVSGVATPLGTALGGPLGDVIGLPALFACCGVLSTACGAAALIPASVRALDR